MKHKNCIVINHKHVDAHMRFDYSTREEREKIMDKINKLYALELEEKIFEITDNKLKGE
jgi:hypothetical protein